MKYYFPSDMETLLISPSGHVHVREADAERLIIDCALCETLGSQVIQLNGGRKNPDLVPLTYGEEQERSEAERRAADYNVAMATAMARQAADLAYAPGQATPARPRRRTPAKSVSAGS